MNLDGFSSGLCDTAGSLSINQEFSSIVEELLKKALGVIDGGMSRYYPVSGSQTSIFHFVHHQNVLMVLVFIKGFVVLDTYVCNFYYELNENCPFKNNNNNTNIG